MKDFILDFRPKLEKLHPYSEEERNELLSEDLDKDTYSFIDRFTNKLLIQGPDDKEPLLPLDELSEGDVIYCDCFDKFTNFRGYYKVVIEHKYWDHLFMTWLDGPLEGERLVIQKGCFLSMHGLYPIKVIGSHPWKLSCNNPKVEFIYD